MILISSLPLRISALVVISLIGASCSSTSKKSNAEAARPDAAARGTTSLETVVLLDAQDHYDDEVKPESLAALAEEVRSTTERHTRRSRPSRMIIEARIHPDRNPTFNISAQGDIDAAEVRALHEHLMSDFALRSRSQVLGLEFYLENHAR